MDRALDAATAFLTFLTSTGPTGALTAAILVGLALVVIILAAVFGVFDDRRNAGQKTDFQAKLLDAIRLLNENEAALRRENADLREDVGRLTVDIQLVRNQNRRIVDLLRAVMDGRIAPAAITLPEPEPEARGA